MILTMDNNNKTTILHQAICSKGDTQARATVIMTILKLAPMAASIANGQGSLPIHAILQRNIKMDSRTRETLATALIKAYPESLLKASSPGGRTALHVAFTDFVSPQLIRMMIAMGPAACFLRDGNGHLPVHIAVSRHCSKEKLDILLEVSPSSLFATTREGESLLDLAKSKATKSHPNKNLIRELKERLASWNGDRVYNEPRMEAVNNVVLTASFSSHDIVPQVVHHAHAPPQIYNAPSFVGSSNEMVPELIPEFSHPAHVQPQAQDEAAANVLRHFRQAEGKLAEAFIGQHAVGQRAEV